MILFRRNDAQPFGFALCVLLAASEPNLHAVEIKIDHWRGVERQQLAQRETADHGVAERLAQLRARAVTERKRYAGKHWGRGGHRDARDRRGVGLSARAGR